LGNIRSTPPRGSERAGGGGCLPGKGAKPRTCEKVAQDSAGDTVKTTQVKSYWRGKEVRPYETTGGEKVFNDTPQSEVFSVKICPLPYWGHKTLETLILLIGDKIKWGPYGDTRGTNCP